jgi:hypothetical protein
MFNLDRRLPAPGEPWVLFRSQAFAMTVDPSGSSDNVEPHLAAVDGSSRVAKLRQKFACAERDCCNDTLASGSSPTAAGPGWGLP